MPRDSNRILLSCLALFIVACLCVSLLSIGGAGILAWTEGLPLIGQPTTSPESIPTNAVSSPTASLTPVPEGLALTPAPEQEASPQAGSPSPAPTRTRIAAQVPAEIASQMDALEDQVIDLRGLARLRPVERTLMTPEELRQHVIENFFDENSPQETRDEVISWAAFGLVEPGFDLYELEIDLYSEQVAGFYDDEVKTMYVVREEGFRGPERMTYAHEFVHALQDQHFDFANVLGYTDEACEEDQERCAAIRAMLEGDATLSEEQWLFNYATENDILELQQFYSDYESPVYDNAPAFLKEDFISPYLSGQAFVRYLYDQGGWSAVDQAYQDPPLSTEQILHPERYPQDNPHPVSLPDLISELGEGWREVDRNTLGEWYTFLVLAYGHEPDARLEIEMAENASQGWGGDAYAVYYQEDSGSTVMVLRSIWDSAGEARQFAEAFQVFASARFGEAILEQIDQNNRAIASMHLGWDTSASYTGFRLDGEQTFWVLAPDAELAEAVMARTQSQ